MRSIYQFFITLFIVLLIVVTAGSFYMLGYSLEPLKRSRTEAITRLAERTPLVKSWVDSIRNNEVIHDTTITLADGTQRHGYYLAADKPSTHTAVLVHGYKDCALSMLNIGYMYHNDLGYNIILPDLWAHGESTGDYIGMGWNERNEVIQWAKVAQHMWRGNTMVLHGVSMGAATVMNASGETLPPYVKAVIEDCGYTSTWDEFSHQLNEQFGLPAFPLLYTTSLLCKANYGWSFGEASPLEQVKKCKVPMLFIHGDKDDFVPTAMVNELYEAYPGPNKQLWLAPGSDHAMAYSDHPREYTRLVREFTDKWVK
ncbi:MAG: alpha/beta hydrolase [Muribaculaceae bacterium]|nr:alpha/beta hydrolase [Muribaculaceae bacterium]